MTSSANELVIGAGMTLGAFTGAGAGAKLPDKRRPALTSAMHKVKAEWHAAFTEPTPLAAFSKLGIKTRLIVGSESPASSRGVARLLTRTLPDVTVVELAGVGHMGPVTHPEKINAEIERFLDRVSTSE